MITPTTNLSSQFKAVPLYNFSLKSENINFNPSLQFNADLWILDPERSISTFDKTTLLTITENNTEKKIRIDWCNYSTSDDNFNTLLINDTGKLFFGARFFWGIIDLNKLKIERQESCGQFWYFEKHSDVVLIVKELEAESLRLDGTFIDKVPIDPPWDIKILENSIEFMSLSAGLQKLKLK